MLAALPNVCLLHQILSSMRVEPNLSSTAMFSRTTVGGAQDTTLHSKALPQWMNEREQLGKEDRERQFSSVAQSRLTLCDPIDCSSPGFPVHHQLLEFAQTHVHLGGDAIQPSHPRSSPSLPAFNLSQHHSPLQRVSSSHQVAKVFKFQL